MKSYLRAFVLLSSIGLAPVAIADPIENDYLGSMPGQPATDIEVVSEQLKQLRGTVEDLQYELASLKDKFAKLSADTEMRFNEGKKADSSNIASENITGGDSQASGSNEEADALYQKGFSFLKEKNYEKAAETLKTFIKKYPTHKQVGSAYYWLGEIKAENKKYEQAVVEYMHGYKTSPKGPRAPDNLLKLGSSLGKIGKKREACIALQKLKKEFPTPSATIQNNMKEQLKHLACE